MAQGNYREQSSYYDYPDPRMQYSSSNHPADPYKPKSRQSSRDRSDGRSSERSKYSQPHQPISEAVNSQDTAAMNPELIAQITEHVIKQLRTNPLEGGTPIHATHQQYPPPPPQQPVPQSPTTKSGSPPVPTRNVYTPPFLQKHSDHPTHGSPEQTSTLLHGGPPTPPDPSNSQADDRQPPTRVNVSNEAGNSRPKGPTRLSTSKEETTLEKIWGQLFDEEGLPTARLGQFLRGLAVHIVCSLKVIAFEMLRFLTCVHRLRIMSHSTVSSSRHPKCRNTIPTSGYLMRPTHGLVSLILSIPFRNTQAN